MDEGDIGHRLLIGAFMGKKMVDCPSCMGRGRITEAGKEQICSRCLGKGAVLIQDRSGKLVETKILTE